MCLDISGASVIDFNQSLIENLKVKRQLIKCGWQIKTKKNCM